MNELALFAGAGLGLLGGRILGWRTVCYVEIDQYCVEVLKARIRDGILDDGPIWDDARTFDGKPWAGRVDIITAGFPCQPWSVAGKRLGERDERNLWPDTARVIGEVRPRYVLLENSPGLLSRLYVQQIYCDLAEMGYDAEWGCISAAAVGAPHIRERLWIFAYTDRREQGRWKRTEWKEEQGNTEFAGYGEKGIMANSNSEPGGLLLQEWGKSPKVVGNGEISDTGYSHPTENGWWAIEPGVGRVVDGCPHRVDRLKAIGNGQVPAVVRAAWRLLK